MNRLRNKLTQSPIKKQFFIHHKQPFLYQYHKLKLNFAKKFPGLIEYLTNLNLPKDIFKESQRISQQKPVEKNFEIREKQNYAVQLAKLAASITKDNKKRHEIKETLESPVKITAYSYDENVRYYYKYFKERISSAKYLLVIVKYLNGKGFIITAYFVRNIK